nr:hypothetical protein Q903MT_gene320 [Picea sitchensis]
MGCQQMVGCADYVSSRELDVMLAFAMKKGQGNLCMSERSMKG